MGVDDGVLRLQMRAGCGGLAQEGYAMTNCCLPECGEWESPPLRCDTLGACISFGLAVSLPDSWRDFHKEGETTDVMDEYIVYYDLCPFSLLNCISGSSSDPINVDITA